MRVREINDFDEFKALEGIWNNLLAKSRDRNIFLTWEWLFTSWSHFGSGKGLHTLLLEDDGDLMGIAALVSARSRYPVIEDMGAGLSDYGGLVYSCKDDAHGQKMLDLLGSYVESNNLILRLDQVPGDSYLYALTHDYAPRGVLIEEKGRCYSPYLSIPRSWDDYQSLLSKKLRKNLRRGERGIERDVGDVTFRVCSTSGSLEEDMNYFWALYQKKMAYKKFPGFNRQQRMFLADVGAKFASNGWLNLSFLEVNGEPVSAVLGFEYDGKYYYYQTAFDPDYSIYGVGMIHIRYLMEYLIDKRFSEFDFLRGDEAYKLRWKPQLRTNYLITVMKDTPSAKIRFRVLDYILRYDEIRKRGLIENYRLYVDRGRQSKERKRLEKRCS